MPEPHRYEDIETVLADAASLPDFPQKASIIRCLELRNVNDYGRAQEIIAEAQASATASGAPLAERLEELAGRIRLLAASDPVSD